MTCRLSFFIGENFLRLMSLDVSIILHAINYQSIVIAFFRKIFIWPTFRFSLVFSRRSVRVIQSAVIDSAIVTEEWKKRGRFGTSLVMTTIFTRSDPDLARFFNPLLLSCRLLLRFILLTKRPEQVICGENGKVGFQKILNELALKKYLAYIREAGCNWGFE